MKKSLSTILSLAMAFSMFSSVAMAADAAKTSADFSDLKDLDAATKAKFDALISAGIFDGVKEGTFGLKDEMNRAQFAKVAALIFGLKVDTTKKTSVFTDVKSDDPANGYALPYIEAVKAAGITDGYGEGIYNPAGKVTKEQLAAFLIRGLNKDSAAKATPGVNDTTVSDWAKGYVAYAISQKLLANGTDGKFGGTSNATRDLLVLSSFEAKAQFKPSFNGKYAIASLKATDANVLALELSGALTDEAAKALKIEVKRDGAVVSSGYTVKWDDKKTVATLTFENKFLDNKFDVTISGVSNLDDTAKTASVTTTKEKITKIDFLTASETIPLGVDKDGKKIQDIRIDFKASNQYGAQSKLSASNFDIRTSDGSVSPVAGEQAFRLTQDMTSANKHTETNDRISITILHEDSGISANRIFTVGLKAQVSKIELGDLLDSAGNKLDAIDGSSGYGYLSFKAWDQYGFRVEKKEVLNDTTSVYTTDGDLEKGTTDNRKDAFVDSVIGDDAAELRLYSKTDEQKDVTVTVMASGSGQSASKVVKISATKQPATVEFGNYPYQLAENDSYTSLQEDAFQAVLYVPMIVKDAKGNLLTADEIVKAYDADKFDLRDNGGISLWSTASKKQIKRTGKYKGYIAIEKVSKKGPASISVRLNDNRLSNVQATWTTSVAAERTMDNIKFSTALKKYMTDGTDNEVKFKFYDQYGQEMKYENSVDDTYKVDVTVKYTGPDAQPDVNTFFQNKKNAAVLDKWNLAVTDGVYKDVHSYYSDPTGGQASMASIYDTSYRFYTNAGAKKGTYELKAELFKKGKRDDGFKSIANANTTLEVLNGTDASNNFTYEVYADKAVNNNTILAAGKFYDLSGTSVEQATYLLTGKRNSTDVITGLSPVANKIGKELKIRVKKGGEEVKTNAQIDSVTSSNQTVAVAVNTKSKVTDNNKFIVAGIDAGTAKMAVVYTDLESKKKTANLDFTTKVESPVVSSIEFKKSEKTGVDRNLFITGYDLGQKTVTVLNPFGALTEKITIKDQFGDEIVSEANGDDFVTHHTQALSLTYYISDIVGGTVADFDATELAKGNVKYTSGDKSAISSFTINVLAPSGASAAFTVNF